MLAVPGMTVTAPKDGDELIGLLAHCARAHDGPFCTRYPRDKVPAAPRPAAEVPRGALRHLGDRCAPGRDVAILAVGTMVQPARAGRRARSPPTASTAAVVNCRFLKPFDSTMLEAIAREHRTIVTVEEGTVVNGFGAYLAETHADHSAPRCASSPSACPTSSWSRRRAPTSSPSSA